MFTAKDVMALRERTGAGMMDFGTVIVYSKARPFNNVF